jgi:transitional endoplasmic reticulum ATPase
VPLAPDVDIADLANRTEGFTGADLETLCKKATLLAISDFKRRGRPGALVVHRGDFLTILENGPSIETTS